MKHHLLRTWNQVVEAETFATRTFPVRYTDDLKSSRKRF